MQKYKCTICGHIYDLEAGDPDSNIPSGTAFETGEVGEPMNFAKAEEFQWMVQERSRRASVDEAAPKERGESRDRLRGELQK